MPVPPNLKASAKNWCFTKHYGGVGQPTKAEAIEMVQNITDDSNYLVYGDETCPTTGQKHFQGYAQFEQKKRLTQLRVLLPQAHWEIANGDDQKNFNYCTKDGDYVEVGERRDTTGGKRGGEAQQERWKRARIAAVNNKLDDVPDDIFVKCYSQISSIAKDNLKLPPDAAGCTGVWIYGPAGVGKSRLAREKFPDAYKKLANKWWCGYKQEENVILDDFDVTHACLGYHIKIWSDRYGFIAENKGGALPCRPKVLCITSNYAPEEIWTDEKILGPIRRRFKIMHMRSPTEIGITLPEEEPDRPALVLPAGVNLLPAGLGNIMGPCSTTSAPEPVEPEAELVVDLSGESEM